MAPVDTADVAAIAAQVFLHQDQIGKSLPITGPEALRMKDVAKRIAQGLRIRVKYVAISPEQRRNEQIERGMPAVLADALYDQSVERLKHPKAAVHLETFKHYKLKPTKFSQFVANNLALFAGN